jgi:hypothetical protein
MVRKLVGSAMAHERPDSADYQLLWETRTFFADYLLTCRISGYTVLLLSSHLCHTAIESRLAVLLRDRSNENDRRERQNPWRALSRKVAASATSL